jgi:hypothetical protein
MIHGHSYNQEGHRRADYPRVTYAKCKQLGHSAYNCPTPEACHTGHYDTGPLRPGVTDRSATSLLGVVYGPRLTGSNEAAFAVALQVILAVTAQRSHRKALALSLPRDYRLKFCYRLKVSLSIKVLLSIESFVLD